jgi:hypothetical protein
MVTQAVTLSMVLYGDFSAVLAVDMLLYCLSLLLEIASIMHLRQSQPDLERAYKIPADGFLLFLFFVPSIAICFIVFASGSLQDWGVTGIFLLAGVALIWLIEWSQDHYPDSYTGASRSLSLEMCLVHFCACIASNKGFVKASVVAVSRNLTGVNTPLSPCVAAGVEEVLHVGHEDEASVITTDVVGYQERALVQSV